MKVLFCTNAFTQVTNGPAKFAHLLLDVNRLRTDDTVTILTEDATGESQNVIPIQLSIPRWLKPAGMFLRMWQYHRAAMRIRSKYVFDVLVYNNAIVSLRSALTFKPVIGFINDDNNASVSWRDAWLRFRWSRKHVFFLTEWLSTRLCSAIVVNSEYLRECLIRRYNAHPDKIVRLYKAIDIPVHSSARNNPEPIILFVKNDYIRGGLLTLIEAIQTMDRKVTLQVAGPPASAAPVIEQIAAKAGVQLQFLGILSQEKVFEHMRKADIFCVPSHREALGVANMEALACGCAVVSTYVGGIPEVMENGKHGWLVPPNDTHRLADALEEALTQTALREEKVRSGQASLYRFQKEQLLNNFMQIMQQYAR